MKIATWNVNSMKVRIGHVLDWLKAASPDVVLLQELKMMEEAFPREQLEDAGYNVAVVGQKTYNGVALLANRPFEVTARALPGDPADEQARYVEAIVGGEGETPVRVASIYLPNGNPVDSPKFPYKLAWMDRLHDHIVGLLATEDAFVLGGDYNICPTDDDVFDPARFADDALCRPESRGRFRAIVNLGLTDAFRAFNREIGTYSYWDYQRGAWQKDNGLRIDHLLCSPQAADRLTAAGIDRTPRGWEKASDHTPVWCEVDTALAGAAA